MVLVSDDRRVVPLLHCSLNVWYVVDDECCLEIAISPHLSDEARKHDYIIEIIYNYRLSALLRSGCVCAAAAAITSNRLPPF